MFVCLLYSFFFLLFVYFVPRDCTERDLDDDRELPEMLKN